MNETHTFIGTEQGRPVIGEQHTTMIPRVEVPPALFVAQSMVA